MCALTCEQMRSITKSARESQVTSDEMQSIVEQVADVKKRATNEDLQRVVNMKEGLEKLVEEARTRQEEVRVKGAEEQEVMMRLEEEVGEIGHGSGQRRCKSRPRRG